MIDQEITKFNVKERSKVIVSHYFSSEFYKFSIEKNLSY